MFGLTTTLLRRGSIPARAHRGIWAGRKIGTGYNVAEDKKSPVKTKRRWLPNVVGKTYRSDILNKSFKVKVTTHAIRCIDKKGGFDNYLLRTPESQLVSKLAIELKQRVQRVKQLKAEAAKQQKQAQAQSAQDSASAPTESPAAPPPSSA